MPKLPKPVNPDSILPWESSQKITPIVSSSPTVSMVIPVYNAGAFIEKTIRSILFNDLNGVELILMDGGSADLTMDIVSHYREFFSAIHSGPDSGQSEAINSGFERASGELFHWLNGDDLLLPNSLTAAREYFRRDPSCQVLVGNAYMTEQDLSPINHFVFSPDKLKFDYLLDYARHHLVQPSVFFSRVAWEDCGPLDQDCHYAMDADLFLTMARKYTIRHLDRDVAYSVYHEHCKTRNARAESITELALVQAKHGGFEEAQNSLRILVELYNEVQNNPVESSGSADQQETNCVKCEALEARINELERVIEDNKQKYLEIDLMELS